MWSNKRQAGQIWDQCCLSQISLQIIPENILWSSSKARICQPLKGLIEDPVLIEDLSAAHYCLYSTSETPAGIIRMVKWGVITLHSDPEQKCGSNQVWNWLSFTGWMLISFCFHLPFPQVLSILYKNKFEVGWYSIPYTTSLIPAPLENYLKVGLVLSSRYTVRYFSLSYQYLCISCRIQEKYIIAK